MKRYLPFIIVAIIAAGALGSGVWLYQSKRAKAAAAAPKMKEEEAASSGESAHVMGPADAPVTIEEFGDFQCPPCGRLSEPLNQLQKEFNFRMIYREFPLAMHSHSREAAYVAEAAARQGKFWQMHDLLFREQAVWSNSENVRMLFEAYAAMIQLDLDRFKKDVDSSEVQQQVELDQRRGAVIGVKTTPTIFLNNQALTAQQLNPTELRNVVEAAVKGPKPSG
jgi:formate-nitrite transporter family protein